MITDADFVDDKRVVLTLDAGGTNFSFSAMQAGHLIGQAVILPAEPHDLDASLRNMVGGFQALVDQLGQSPAAISFAFPGPADYPNGVIFNVGNLPAYQGGVAVGPMLEERFGVPVFLNNDGDLFVYGEAIGGLLPKVNRLLAEHGSPKQFKNLFGVTLGTGFGGGIVRDGELFLGDNSNAGEVWLLRNKVAPGMNAEEGASIRAVRRVYAEKAGMAFDEAPEPKDIYAVGVGKADGDQKAARESFQLLGKVVGDALGNALTLLDGLAVIGGGLSGAASLFLPSIVDELNSHYTGPDGRPFRRLVQQTFNLEDEIQLRHFLSGDKRTIAVPGTNKQIECDPMARLGVGLSVLGTNEAVATGAYAFAIKSLDT